MSNPSLKDQLQSLSLGLSSAQQEPQEPRRAKQQSVQTSGKPARPAQQQPAKAQKQKPAWLEHAQYGVELLKAHFPLCFKELKEIHPLKIGIKQDLVKHLGGREDITLGDKACMVNSLAYYVNSIAYHKNVMAGMNRIDLDGNPAGIVTEEEAQYSVDSRKTKLQKKQPANQEAK